MKKTHLLVLALLLGSPLAFSADYEIDQDHSTVGFKIRHLVSKVNGTFNQFSGSVHYDKAKVSETRFKGTVETISINTANAKRDEHLKSPDFFDAAKFPKLEFESTQVKDLGGGKAKVTGNLTMHGVKKEVILDVEFLGEATDPWGTQRLGLSATGTLNRKDFGINWNKTLDKGGVMLGEDVEIKIDIEAKMKADMAPSKPAPAKKKS